MPVRIRTAGPADVDAIVAFGAAVVGVCQTGELHGEQVVWKLSPAPEHRGRSLGLELLGQAMASLPASAGHVDVEHVAGNTSAARFYEREGFEVLRTEPAPPDRPAGAAIVWRRRRLPQPDRCLG